MAPRYPKQVHHFVSLAPWQRRSLARTGARVGELSLKAAPHFLPRCMAPESRLCRHGIGLASSQRRDVSSQWRDGCLTSKRVPVSMGLIGPWPGHPLAITIAHHHHPLPQQCHRHSGSETAARPRGAQWDDLLPPGGSKTFHPRPFRRVADPRRRPRVEGARPAGAPAGR